MDQFFRARECFFDIGANVGTYSIYAARIRDASVIAIEISPPNLDLLLRNIRLNSISEQIIVFPIGISDSTQLSKIYFSLSNFVFGGAHNSVGRNVNKIGNEMQNVFSIKSPSFAFDDLTKYFIYQSQDTKN